jgi:geranylgeranyl reductase family protein
LAAAGVRVVLLDRATFPRDKICGDAVTREGLEVLERSGLAKWAAQFKPIEVLRFTSPDLQVLDVPVKLSNNGCVGRIIPRQSLDVNLVQAAVKAGADLKEGIKVQTVHIDQQEGCRVVAQGLEVAAQVTILAEGSNAGIARRLGLLQETFDLLAVRQYLAGDIDPAGPLEFHFQQMIIPGYTWMFPVGNGHLNIGAGTYTWRVRSKAVDLRAVLEHFKANHPVIKKRLAQTEPLGAIKGHPLRTHLGGTRTHANRTLVVGDAAGLVSPFTGEGIASGMRSGEMAASQVLNALAWGDFSAEALAPYTRSLEARYKGDQRAGRILRTILKYPRILDRFIRRLRQDKALALLFGHIFLDEKSPRRLLAPKILLRLLA